MRAFIFSFSIFFMLSACNNSSESNNQSFSSFELRGRDTVNKMDVHGKKQGVWYEPHAMDPNAEKVIYKDGVKQ